MSNLQTRLQDAAKITEALLEDTKEMRHPQAQLFRACLQEQRHALSKLLPLLAAGETQLDPIASPISILFNSSDVATLPEASMGQQIPRLFTELKRQLEETAVELEQLYGADAILSLRTSFIFDRQI